jgi:hypothetical protein
METNIFTLLVTFIIILFITAGKASASIPQSSTLKLSGEWPVVFDASLINNGTSVLINWKADSEQSEIYYEVQSSTNNKVFKTAAIILGGFSNEQNFIYSFKDKNTTGVKTYYRIKQINKDGSFRIVSEQSL